MKLKKQESRESLESLHVPSEDKQQSRDVFLDSLRKGKPHLWADVVALMDAQEARPTQKDSEEPALSLFPHRGRYQEGQATELTLAPTPVSETRRSHHPIWVALFLAVFGTSLIYLRSSPKLAQGNRGVKSLRLAEIEGVLITALRAIRGAQKKSSGN